LECSPIRLPWLDADGQAEAQSSKELNVCGFGAEVLDSVVYGLPWQTEYVCQTALIEVLLL
jgi:hypothetical protein